MKRILLFITITLITSSQSFANGEISFKKLTTGVTRIVVRSRLILSTRDHDLTPIQVEAINSSLTNYLNRSHKYTDRFGEKFELSFNVVAVKDSEITTPRSSDNFIELELGGRDSAYPKGLELTNYDKKNDQADVIYTVGNTATISVNRIDAYSTTVSHETLHLLGLDDRYHDLVSEKGAYASIADNGFDEDIMNCRSLEFNPLHIEAFVSLVRSARAQGTDRFEIIEVTNLKVGHISEKPMYLNQLPVQH